MIISQNTVWAAGAVQDLDGEVVEIAPGVTLRIEAGATVNGGDFHAYGHLDIEGTPTTKVTLNDVSIGTRGYAGRVDVDHAHMTGGAFFPPTGEANAATFALTNSTIEGVNAGSNGWTFAYVWYPEAPVLISGNSFINSGGFSIGNAAGRAVTIKNNSFDNWVGSFAVKNWAAYGGSVTVVEGNVFLDAGRVALELPSGYPGLSGISCVIGHDGKEGASPWPDGKSHRYRMRSWTSCCPGRRPARRSTVAACWTS